MRRGGVYTLFLFFVTVFGSLGMGLIPVAEAKTRAEVSVFLPGAAYNPSLLTNFESSLGIKFAGAKWYQNWADNFDPTPAKNFHDSGHIPELTWEPERDGSGIAYDRVIAGDYDAYLTTFAQTVASLGFPIRISLAPEMNTNWTPWGICAGEGGEACLQGNNATNFKGFWQRVIQKFRDAGASNVSWIWSPNVIPANANQLYGGKFSNIYPGDAYVDYMGLDGYNWGGSRSWSEWQSFSQVFGSSYHELTSLSGKEILIMEMASTETGGNKAAWITDLFNQLQTNFPRIKGFTWFSINKETDWRINSSEAAKTAFVNGYNGASPGSSTPAPTGSTANKPTPASKAKTPVAGQTTASDSATAAPIAEPTDVVYPPTQPAQPKIAGTLIAAERSRASFNLSELAIIFTELLIGFVLLGGLFYRRFHSLHQPVARSLGATVRLFGLGLVDSVFLPTVVRRRLKTPDDISQKHKP